MGDVNSKKQQAHHLRAIFLASKALKAKPTEKSVPPFARVKSSLLRPEGDIFLSREWLPEARPPTPSGPSPWLIPLQRERPWASVAISSFALTPFYLPFDYERLKAGKLRCKAFPRTFEKSEGNGTARMKTPRMGGDMDCFQLISI